MPIIKAIREDILSSVEVDSLIDRAESLQDKAIITVLYLWGCRITEALNIKREDVTINEQDVNIRFTVLKRKSRSGIPFRHSIPISRRTPFIHYFIDYIESLNYNTEYIFHRKSGGRLSRWDINKMLKRLDPNIWCHLFRHTRLTKLAEAGASASQIMAWAGHSDLRASGRYIQRSTRLLKDLKNKVR